jgi:hypothetical protein
MTKLIIERLSIVLTILAFLFFAFIMTGKAKAQYEILGKISSYIATDNTFGRDKSDIVIYGAGKKLVTITYKGQIVYEDDYDPDVTAKAFWENLGEKRSCK